MGLFKKKTQKEELKKRKPEPTKLPELPKLPEFPDFEEQERKGQLSKLPKFPDSSLGQKFSQHTIKEAVAGEKEEHEEVPEADEFVLREEQMMPRPLGGSVRTPSTQPIPASFKEAARRVKEIEPIFIRIDKFEESLHAFEKAKQQITEIEKMLRNIKRLKEEEEKELSMWEREIQTTKQQIEKIDQDIFSRVE
jgi:peptidoglycan hydrolase CwlO-like protein